jgi:DNA repair exonuclease SbcCD nuclease subunit
VIGDMGNASRRQLETARQMWAQHQRFPFEFVLTVGDNIYGDEAPSDMLRKFVQPYQPIIEAKIPFYASLGNHDERSQVNYPLFNMNGRAYYTFTRGSAQFFALDSTRLTQEQLRWFEDEITRSTAPWRIAYFHHPIYSSGLRHGPLLVLRAALEPILSTFGVRVVFTGHEHFYERLHPRYGVYPFITGSGGQLRRGGIRDGSEFMAAGYDQDNVFMLVEIACDTLRFEAITRTGAIVDSGVISRTDQ